MSQAETRLRRFGPAALLVGAVVVGVAGFVGVMTLHHAGSKDRAEAIHNAHVTQEAARGRQGRPCRSDLPVRSAVFADALMRHGVTLTPNRSQIDCADGVDGGSVRQAAEETIDHYRDQGFWAIVRRGAQLRL